MQTWKGRRRGYLLTKRNREAKIVHVPHSREEEWVDKAGRRLSSLFFPTRVVV